MTTRISGRFFGDTAVLLGRSLRHISRSPDTIVTTAITPIAMMLMFVYVFGGAIDTGSHESYVSYQLPGILLITIASGIAYTAYRLFNDLQNGIFERFNSMPIARSSALWGHVLTSLIANLVSLVLVVLVAVGIIGLALLALSTTVRRRLHIALLTNLYQYKYDYRDEWLRLNKELTTLSADDSLGVRAIRALGKTPVEVNDFPGFVANRMMELEVEGLTVEAGERLQQIAGVAAPVVLQVGAHLPRPRVGCVCRPMSLVDRPESIRDEQLDLLAQQLLAVVCEQLLRALVDEHDSSGGVGEHDRVWCGFEQRLEPTHLRVSHAVPQS
jgi:cell division protein FtsL